MHAYIQALYIIESEHRTGSHLLPRKHLDDAIAAAADDPLPVLTPDDGADALAAHDAVGGDFLRTGALFETPEAERGVVAG